MKSTKEYGIADKAWQPVIGCDPHMACAPRCWARKATERTVECLRGSARGTDTEAGENLQRRAEFFRVALTPDGQKWSGEVFLDPNHMDDPCKWRKPAVIATGFHGDWGRLGDNEKDEIFQVIVGCQRHDFMLLTKQPQDVLKWAKQFKPDGQGWITRGGLPADSEANVCAGVGRWPPKNASIGCSVMNQAEADKMREPMAAIAALGWRTHVWYEPALGPVDWKGWEFLELIIPGGESGPDARPCDLAWLRSTRDWAQASGVKCFIKQLGAMPMYPPETILHPPRSRVIRLKDRKGADPEEWPADLRVQEMREVRR